MNARGDSASRVPATHPSAPEDGASGYVAAEKLSARARLLVKNLLSGMSVAAAARAAGYAASTAGGSIYRCLRGQKLRQALAKAMDEAGITNQAIFGAIRDGLEGRETRFFPFTRRTMTGHGKDRVTVLDQEIETREVINHETRLRAAELAGRFRGYLRPEAAPAPEEAAAQRPSVVIHIGCCDGGPAHASHAKIVTPSVKPIGAGGANSRELPSATDRGTA